MRSNIWREGKDPKPRGNSQRRFNLKIENYFLPYMVKNGVTLLFNQQLTNTKCDGVHTHTQYIIHNVLTYATLSSLSLGNVLIVPGNS